MNRTQIGLLVLLALVAALTVYLFMRNPEAPLIPADPDHGGVASAEACLSCHGKDGPVPQSPTHPIGRDCTQCHGYR